jgi:LysM repeat protein
MAALKRWWVGLALLLVAAAPLLIHVSAQGANLLQDPGFEGPYVNRGRANLNTPASWPIWIADGPRNAEWMNRSDKVTAFPHNNGPEIHSGAASLNIDGGFVTYTAAVYQQVSTTPGTNLTGSAWARIKTCNIAPNTDNCGSAVESGAFVRVGIDPNGGTDPNNPSIVWSGNIAPHDNYQQATVSATAAAGTVTLFIYTTQSSPSALNRAWFDDAVLTTGGAGGSAPAQPGQPTAVPPPVIAATAFLAFVQPPRPDGSVVHIVTTGDTMTGISNAYGVPIEEIMELNGLRGSRFIFVGQELLIKPAGSGAGASTSEPDSESTDEVGSGSGTAPRATPAELFSPEDLALLNSTPGPTPIGMTLDGGAGAGSGSGAAETTAEATATFAG